MREIRVYLVPLCLLVSMSWSWTSCLPRLTMMTMTRLRLLQVRWGKGHRRQFELSLHQTVARCFVWFLVYSWDPPMPQLATEESFNFAARFRPLFAMKVSGIRTSCPESGHGRG